MYIFSETMNIDDAAHSEWVSWIESHITNVLNTGRFLSAKFSEVLIDEEMGGKTYSVQYTAATKLDIENYYKFDATDLQLKIIKKFGDKMLTFRTELKIIQEYYPPTSIN
jgi:hypothetical protein